jgi:hypothetical protein
MFLLARKLGNLFKFYRWPGWANEKKIQKGTQASQANYRLPKMAEYNPLRGVSVSSLEVVGDVLRRLSPIKGKPSPVLLDE